MSQAVDDNDFTELLGDYKKKYGVYPSNPPQLLSHAQETGRSMRYSAINNSLRQWIVQNQEEYNRNISSSTLSTNKEEKTENAGNTNTEGLCWDVIWEDYVKVYNYPPKEPLHLWNHSKDMKYQIKYSEVRNVFSSLQLKYNVQDSKNTARRHTVAAIEKKQEQINKEQFDEYVQQYVNKYKYDPKDARMLFNFCADELNLSIKYGAVSRAFSTFYTPPKDSKRRHSMPAVMTRFGQFVEYDDFISGSTLLSKKPLTPHEEEPSDDHETTTENTNEGNDNNNSNTNTDNGNNNTSETPSQTSGNINDNESKNEPSVSATPQEAESKNDTQTTLLEENDQNNTDDDNWFNTVWIKYEQQYQKPPQNARQLLSFANENGHNVTYLAIRRAWPSNIPEK